MATTRSLAPIRHSLWVFLTLALSVSAANLPRFAFAQAGVTPTAFAVDSDGNTYLTGNTQLGLPFTPTPGAFQAQNPGGECFEAPRFLVPCVSSYVIKLDPSGAVVFATYLGGGGNAVARAIAVDAQRNVYIAGTLGEGIDSGNPSFPVTPGAAFSTGTSFLTKLNPSGTGLVYSTLIPGSGIASIALDNAGDLYFTGWGDPTFVTTAGVYGPTYPIIQGSYNNRRTMAGELNATGSALAFSTYVPGAVGPSSGAAIALDAAGNVLIAETDDGTDGAVGHVKVLLNKLSSDGAFLLKTSVFGSAFPTAIKLAPSGDIYIVCAGAAPDFPVTGGLFGVIPPPSNVPGEYPNFLMHVAADGSTLLSSLNVPFVFPQTNAALDIDAAGNVYLTGAATDSEPTTIGAFLSSQSAGAIVAKLTPDGAVVGSTYVNNAQGTVIGIAAERDGSVVVMGSLNQTLYAQNLFPAITIENSASYVANTAVPGALLSIQGYGIGPAQGVNSAPATTVSGVRVYFDSVPAPITYAQANQINVQAPWEIAAQTSTKVRVLYNGAEYDAVVPVRAADPGVFYINNPDGTRNSPSNPARAGDFVAIYATGGGTLNPAGLTGATWPSLPLSLLTQSVAVTVAGESAQVLYAGSAPTLNSGFFQVNLRLPSDLTSGTQSLAIAVGGIKGAPTPIAIR